MSRDGKPQSWIGRGLEDVSGRPFGWAHNREREEIRAHLRRRLWRFLPRGGFPASVLLEDRVTKIQMRLHKYKPSFRERQDAARARGERWVAPPPGPPPVIFTDEELERIAEHFAGANDPVAQSVWAKASRRSE